MKTLISRYTHNDSMCTACIQTKHKQRFIRVPVKSTTKPFKRVHLDVCGPSSTPTMGNNRYYMLGIDDYTRYTSVWLLPIRKAKPAPPPTIHFRPEYTQWDMRSSDSGAIIDGENMTIRPSVMSSWPTVLHTRHALHKRTIKTVLPK